MFPKTILVTNKTNIRYLSGFAGTTGYVVLHGTHGFLFTDARYHLLARRVLPSGFRLVDITDGFEHAWKTFLKKYRVKKVGIEGGAINFGFFKYLKRISKGIRLVDSGENIDCRRICKTKKEIAKITKAQQITDKIFALAQRWLHPGLSEKAIAWKIELLAREYGAEDISFPPIVAFNENTASPHHHPTNKKLKRGDLILFDMGVLYHGYCSDMTRMLFTKPPTAEQEKIYLLVKKAQEEAIQKLKAGVTGAAADSFARKVIEAAGFGKKFGHSLGHGVGLEVHELPNVSKKYTKKIPEDSVVTVEPGVYLPGKFGVRLEDMVLVKKNGVRNLTKSPKAIQECILRLQ